MTKAIITRDFLLRHLRYCDATGVFTRLKPSPRCAVGEATGWVDNRGYVKIGLCGSTYLAHRLAWLYVYGEFPKYQIDHINHVRDDNRISNLRLAKHLDNGRNQKIHSTNTSGIGGVSFAASRNKWRATIRVKGIDYFLGGYAEWWDAVCARKSANNRFGFHHNHGQ